MNGKITDFSRLGIEQAQPGQPDEISDLVNLTYRGDVGWTRETHIVQGDRTNRNEVSSAIANPAAHFLVVNQEQKLASCIYVAKEENSAYIGFFSVHPSLQGKGVGKHVLKQAEAFALAKMDIQKFVMFVVSQRPELIAFYERRGYVRTGRIETYPLHPGIGVPKVKGLTIEYLEKVV
ncbi:MAG: GNAT family N-acetyltransferase [Nitrosomonas sp.]|nr:GNAT family N-acetyltransferase [Nitrosomonas sp.]MDP1950830.1 GNAT family N-acetyltransferase [Nitrosomonas sp.]